MATRTPSKILSVAEKKTAEAGLKLAIKNKDADVKTSEAVVAVATKGLVAAKKKADVLLAEAVKTQAIAQRKGDKLIAAAQKVIDAAAKKHTKVFDAATKGKEKLTGQLASLATAPVETAKRGRPPGSKNAATTKAPATA